MSPIIETAPAKINLALHVRHRRADGYHELETLFAFAEDGDRITVVVSDAPVFTITGPFAAELDAGGDNLVTRAAAAFGRHFGIAAHHTIALHKALPIASGIGGGSADAAATLRALARLHGIAPDHPDLFGIAAGLGADVPACLLGRTALGRGKGDALEAIGGMPGRPLLLVNPGVGVSTAAVFACWDGVDRGAIAEGDLLTRAVAGRNDLEASARALAPAIDAVLALLAVAPGAVLSRMSGSGATCFALFDDVAARREAALAAAAQGWWVLETRLGA
ncbi:4-(cytidine 5'-diphospho)-2-C-methyl-D-erythritol kinase [Sphingomonas sp.]|uniref:4-(cytidine 5'-diphospho)-2-C-methyl-D-erythritol kinase n=1 Tax=Sphingomonas sp. TaxID=28214 RepID=UPI0035ADE633